MMTRCLVCKKKLKKDEVNFCSSECYHASDEVLNE